MRLPARRSSFVLLISALLLACPDPVPTGPDAGCDPTDPNCENCQPSTCESLGAGCGMARDGCGGVLACGDCVTGTCGGGGVPNKCGEGPCVPTTCAEGACGTQSDGCSGELQCGDCTAPLTCGGGGRDGICGCAAESDASLCQRLGAACGTVSATDACEVTRQIYCGSCPDGQSCGGGGTANQCACKPATCLNRCGRFDDGCGGTLDCTCTAPQTCGGSGTEGICGCTPVSCESIGACGLIADGCGRSIRCGCTAPESCGGAGEVGRCGCVPKDCAAQGITCGEAYDGCGQMIECGTCSGTVKVRLMAANITSGNLQSYDPGEGIRIFQAFAPDVVMIQEFNYGDNGAASIRAMVDTAFGANFYYYREAGSSIPNGVVSRYPIVASGEWDDTVAPNRDYAWARIDLPGPRDLWVVSVHLLTTSSGDRTREANEIVAKVKSLVPANDYLAIGGDLNTGTTGESCITTALRQVVVTAAPYPEDQRGNSDTNAGRNKPYDWVLADQDLDDLETPVRIGSNSFSSGLVFDSRVYSPLSDVAPVLRNDSGALNVQHMAVIRDFVIPRQ